MISYSPAAIEPHYRPAIVLFLLVAVLFFASGYLLGASDGRDERAMLRRAFAVMDAAESKSTGRQQPCAPVFLTRPVAPQEQDDEIKFPKARSRRK